VRSVSSRSSPRAIGTGNVCAGNKHLWRNYSIAVRGRG
jgi:hypothetical protein